MPGHSLAEPGGSRRTRTDRRCGNLSSGGHLESRRDTGGYATNTVRDREAPGSNPGRPTISVFKSAISEFLWSQRHTAGSQFPTGQPNRGGANRVVVGYVRSLVATGGHAASLPHARGSHS